MKTYLVLITALALAFNAMGQQEKADTNLSGVKAAKNKTVKGKKEGLWVEYFGEKDGVAIKTNKKHATAYTLTIYKAGTIQASKQYYMDGHLMTNTVRNEKGEFVLRFYYENGNKLMDMTYPNDSANRTATMYYESGKVKKVTIYNKQNKEVAVTNYDENGRDVK